MTAPTERAAWPVVGAVLAAVLMAWDLALGAPSLWRVALHLQLLALLTHQIDEFTWPGGFAAFYNQHIYRRSPLTRFPLTPLGVILVNVLLGWGLYGWSAWTPDEPVLAAGLALAHLVNATAHIGMALAMRRPNPGLLTAVTVLIPMGVFTLWLCSSRLTGAQWPLALVFVPGAVVAIQSCIGLTSWLHKQRKDKDADST